MPIDTRSLFARPYFPTFSTKESTACFVWTSIAAQARVETEFMTVMWFTNQTAIVRFAGSDWETAVVPASARSMLLRFDEKAAHYESRVAKEASPHV
jgi:hypothetical protein